jgi:hypothetical protein
LNNRPHFWIAGLLAFFFLPAGVPLAQDLHGPVPGEDVGQTEDGLLALSEASAADLQRYFGYKPEQWVNKEGQAFDAFVSNAKRYDTFEGFTAAQQAISKDYLKTTKGIEASRLKILELFEALPTLYVEKVATRNAFVRCWNSITEVNQALAKGGITVAEEMSLRAQIPELERERKRLYAPASEKHFAFLAMREEFSSENWKLAILLRNEARLDVDYMSNIHLNEDELRPRYVMEVRLHSRFGDVYRAKWKSDEDIEALARQRDEAHRMIGDLKDVLADLEKQHKPMRTRLEELDAKWHALNEKSYDKVVSQLWAEGLLEVVDVGISVKGAGPAYPVAILFEGIWRGGRLGKYLVGKATGTSIGEYDRKIAEPRLQDGLIDARNALAQTNQPYAQRTQNQFTGFKQPVVDAAWAYEESLEDDTWKAFAATIFEIAKDRAAHSALRTSMMDVDYWSVVNTLGYEKNKPRAEAEVLAWFTGPAGAKVADLDYVRRLMKGDPGSVVAAVDDNLASINAKGVLSSVGTTLAVNAGKVAAMTVYDLERHQIEREKAETELLWFAARNSLRASFVSQLDTERVIRVVMVEYAKQHQALAADCCMRTPEVDDGLGAVIKRLEDDYSEEEELELIITVDKPVFGPRFKIGAESPFREFKSTVWLDSGAEEWRAPVLLGELSKPNEKGTVSLAIEAGRNKPIHMSLDGECIRQAPR